VKNILYWGAVSGVFVMGLRFGKLPVLISVSILSFLSIKEYFTVIPSRRADRVAHFIGYLSIPLVFYFMFIDWYTMFIITIPVYVFLLLPMALSCSKEKTGLVQSLGRISFGVLLLVHCFGHAGYLFILNPKWVITIFFLTEISDRLPAFLSSKFKWEASPSQKEIGIHKEWKGLLIGFIVVCIIAYVIRDYNDWNLVHSMVIACLVFILSFMGTQVVSSVRYDLGMTGSNTLIPGHGLILDRVRALCITFPILFHYLRYFLT